MEIKHQFHSPKDDGGDSTLVKPSDWNREHNMLTTAGGVVIGRDVSGAGAAQELPLQIDSDGRMQVSGTNGFAPAKGTTAQRPTVPRAGEMRWNTTMAVLEIWNGSTWVAVSPAGFVNVHTQFAVFSSVEQVIPQNTATKILFNSKTFDQADAGTPGGVGVWNAANSRFECQAGYEGFWSFDVSVGIKEGGINCVTILQPHKMDVAGQAYVTNVEQASFYIAPMTVKAIFTVQIFAGEFVDFRIRHNNVPGITTHNDGGFTRVTGYRVGLN